MEVRFHDALEEIPAGEWNRLAGEADPFLRHEFLAALERHGCVGAHYGWMPRHMTLRDTHGELLGAVPMYAKTNSYGELVFDWAWAEAYQRYGQRYYPKLVVAVPYTPATGRRLLLADVPSKDDAATALIRAGRDEAERLGMSSVHWLFPDTEQQSWLTGQGLLPRTAVQFHWHNPGYAHFDDFLDTLTAAKRKKIRRERRRVAEAGVQCRVLHGDEMNDEQWRVLHSLYASTFDKKSGMATLSLPFFLEVGRTMARSIVIVLAYEGERIVAGAINFRGTDTLYGRHWGCFEDYHSLHFEACYYVGQDYCIEHGLKRFEPGAQGEHKISRGFLPTRTWSAHWLVDPRFRDAIARHLEYEGPAMEDYYAELMAHSPYRAPSPSP